MAQHPREPLMGLLLSIVLPGLGQMYAGKFLRGIVALVLVVTAFAGVIWYYLLPNVKIGPYWYMPFLVPVFIDLIVIADSYIQVVKYNAFHKRVSTISLGILILLCAGIISAITIVNVFYIGISLINAKFIRSYVTPPESMAPSIYAGERVFVDLRTYKKASPKRGEVVLYRSPVSLGRINMHRVVGLPGESVELKDHRVMINGKPVKESWCERIRYYNRGKFGQKKMPVIVPVDSFFVVGDASANSNDSRFWGFVPKANLIGNVFKIYYPFNRSGPI